MTSQERIAASEPDSAEDVLARVDSRLDAGRAQGDVERLETLEDIRRTLENELERDLDQAGPPRS